MAFQAWANQLGRRADESVWLYVAPVPTCGAQEQIPLLVNQAVGSPILGPRS